MDPYIAVAIAVFPETLQIISRGPPEATVKDIVAAVKEATGADSAEAARTRLADANQPAVALDLRVRLAQILGDVSAAADAAEPSPEKMSEARGTMLALATINESLASTPAIISYIVVCGFFVLVFLLVTGHASALKAGADPTLAQLSNTCIGALAASFATVLNFWLGSSLGSRRKDAAVSQASTVEQTKKLASATTSS